MKILKSISAFLFACLFSATSVSASTAPLTNSTTEKNALRTEVTHLISDMEMAYPDLQATLTFTITEKNRIKIQSVACIDHEICRRIKQKVDGRRVATKMSDKTATHDLVVTFKE